MPMGVKRAVLTASEYLADVMRISPDKLVLEEVELSEDGRFWQVTFSYPTPETKDMLHILRSRSYKIVRLNAEDGSFVSIKIRQV